MRASRIITGAPALAGAALAFAGAAAAQEVPSGAPPSWPALIHCAQLADDDAQLACFKTAMRAAGYAPRPEAVTAERHRRFGLSMPQIGILRHKSQAQGAQAAASPAAQPAPEASAPPPAPEASAAPPAAVAAAPAPPPGVAARPEDESHVYVTLERVAIMPPLGRLLLVTTDGGIWEQTDSETVAPLPRQGQSMEIRRQALGGYMCVFDKHQGVRCARTH